MENQKGGRDMRAGRFPDTIIRRRESPGERSDAGEYIHGAVSQTTLRASVQPISLEDDDLPEGARYSNRLRVYVPEADALAAAFEDAPGDKVIVDGLEYAVEETQSWRGHHTRAVLLRTP